MGEFGWKQGVLPPFWGVWFVWAVVIFLDRGRICAMLLLYYTTIIVLLYYCTTLLLCYYVSLLLCYYCTIVLLLYCYYTTATMYYYVSLLLCTTTATMCQAPPPQALYKYYCKVLPSCGTSVILGRVFVKLYL